MWSYLMRLLHVNTPATSPDWIGDHPNAEQVQPDGATRTGRFSFRDPRTAERANYYTDDLGNVEGVDIYVE